MNCWGWNQDRKDEACVEDLVDQHPLKVVVILKDFVWFDESVHVTAAIDHFKEPDLIDANTCAGDESILDSEHPYRQTELGDS